MQLINNPCNSTSCTDLVIYLLMLLTNNSYLTSSESNISRSL